MTDEPTHRLLSCAQGAGLHLFQREKYSKEMDVRSQGTCRGVVCVTGNGGTCHDMDSSQEVSGRTPSHLRLDPSGRTQNRKAWVNHLYDPPMAICIVTLQTGTNLQLPSSPHSRCSMNRELNTSPRQT